MGVDDPYAHVDRCDRLTHDGHCRYAVERAGDDPQFARERREEGFRCPVADPDGDWEWKDCPHFRSRAEGGDRECTRCGLAERRVAHAPDRPLIEEHHLSYPTDDDPAHAITVSLCRWCHAKVHRSWARIDDDAGPDPEAIAALEERRSREHEEFDFDAASERYDSEEDTPDSDDNR